MSGTMRSGNVQSLKHALSDRAPWLHVLTHKSNEMCVKHSVHCVIRVINLQKKKLLWLFAAISRNIIKPILRNIIKPCQNICRIVILMCNLIFKSFSHSFFSWVPTKCVMSSVNTHQ